MGMYEVKQDPLEASFEALERQDEEVAQLREEMAQLKSRMDGQAIAGARPALRIICARGSSRASSCDPGCGRAGCQRSIGTAEY